MCLINTDRAKSFHEKNNSTTIIVIYYMHACRFPIQQRLSTHLLVILFSGLLPPASCHCQTPVCLRSRTTTATDLTGCCTSVFVSQVLNGHFVHYFAPKDLPAVPKNVVFVIDTSASMLGTKIRQVLQYTRKKTIASNSRILMHFFLNLWQL